MLYSVWDHARREYQYYRTPKGSSATSSPKPAHLRAATLGASPEAAAWPLPANAKMVGVGKYPKGYIAVKKSAVSSLGLIPDLTTNNVILYGALGFLAWKYVIQPKMK